MPATVFFPHTCADSNLLERLCETFGSLILCQPWFTEPTVSSDLVEKETLKICFPPDHLKPKEDFHHLLSEYRNWMTENHGKNRSSSFATGQTGDETWAIRKAIREAGKDADDPAIKNTLKWHLLLHLARNLEQERETSQELLKKATAAKSPLVEALATGELAEDEKIPDMFQDLPLSTSYPYVTERHLRLIFEAWLGLFGTVIPADAHLLTLDRQVMNYALDLFDGCEAEPKEVHPAPPQKEEIGTTGFTVHRRSLPKRLNASASTDCVLSALAGKTFILVER